MVGPPSCVKTRWRFFCLKKGYKMSSLLNILKKEKDMLFIFVILIVSILMGIGCLVFAIIVH